MLTIEFIVPENHLAPIKYAESSEKTGQFASVLALVDHLKRSYSLSVFSASEVCYSDKTSIYYYPSLEAFLDRRLAKYSENDHKKSIAVLDFRMPQASLAELGYFQDVVFLDRTKESFLLVNKVVERISQCSEKKVDNRIIKSFFKTSFVGHSSIYKNVVESVYKYAICQAPVLIEGETGTGKEALARGIHYFSDVSNNGFIPVNCSAIPDSLFESELFGHEKGAFTNAESKHKGLIDLAEGGTLFLDEVDTLSDKAQTGLLRFLQTGEVRSVGGSKIRHVNVRVVSATNSRLSQAVKEGRFRADLMFRLNVLTLKVPPLRDRISDLDVIIQHLLQRFEKKYQYGQKVLHPEYLAWLKAQPWPGNVRELENCLLRKYLLSDSSIIKGDNEEVTSANPDNFFDAATLFGGASFQDAKEKAVDRFAERYICSVLTKTSGNVTCAARLAGKERRAFGKLMKKYSIDAKTFCAEQ